MGKFTNFLAGIAETAIKVTSGKDVDLNKDGSSGVQIGTGYYKSWEKDSEGNFIQPKPTIKNNKDTSKGGGGTTPRLPGSKGSRSGEDDEDGGFMDVLMKPIMGIPLVALALGGYFILPKLLGGATSAAPRRRRRVTRRRRR